MPELSTVATTDYAAGMATDAEVATAVANHAAAADPHTVYQKESEKDQASGYAGLDGSSKLTGSQQKYGTSANTATEGNDGRLAKLASDGGQLLTLQTVSGASATVDANADQVGVTHTGAQCVLTLRGASDHPVGTQILVWKMNTSAFGISVVPDSGSKINGGATDAAFTPSFFLSACSASLADPCCLLTRISSTEWRAA